MSSAAQTATWFDESRNPASLIDAAYVFGGTHLLREFFGRVADSTMNGRLLLVAPFLDAEVLKHLSAFQGEHAKRTDLLLLTTPQQAKSAAARRIAALPWYRCEIRALRGLHAKLYVSLPADKYATALIGSHNLTCAAAFSNIEAGVLLSGICGDARQVINSLIEHVLVLKAASTTVYDSLSWLPLPSAPAA